MTKIPTWDERCEVHPDHQTGMVTNAMIQMRMQEEIDDLRDANEQLRVALNGLVYWISSVAQDHVPNHRFHGTGGFDFMKQAHIALGEEK